MPKAHRYAFRCNFCEKRFVSTIGRYAEVTCKHCGEHDVELLGEVTSKTTPARAAAAPAPKSVSLDAAWRQHLER